MMSIPIGYVYETVNLVNGKTYVGRRNLDRDKSWRQYLGSGKIVNQAIAKYGRENFRKRLLGYAHSVEELADLETEWIQRRKAEGFAQYNLFTSGHAGGDTFSKLKNKTLEEVRQRQSEGIRNLPLVKASIKRRAQERKKLKRKYRKSVIESYEEHQHMDKVVDELELSKKLVTEILHENNARRAKRSYKKYSSA